MTLPTASSEAKKKLFLAFSNKKTKFRSTMQQETLNYIYILSKENVIKSLSYEEAIKNYAAKKCRKERTIRGYECNE